MSEHSPEMSQSPPTTSTTAVAALPPSGSVIQWTEKVCVEVLDPDQDKWFKARVVEIDSERRRVKLHFYKWHTRFDSWLDMDSPCLRVSQRKSHSTATVSPKPVGGGGSGGRVGRPGSLSSAAAASLSVGSYALAKWRNGLDYLCKVEAVLPNPKATGCVQYHVRFIIDDVAACVVPSNIKPISLEKAEHLLKTLNEPLPEEEVIYDATLLRFRDRCRARRRRLRDGADDQEEESGVATAVGLAEQPGSTRIKSPQMKRHKATTGGRGGDENKVSLPRGRPMRSSTAGPGGTSLNKSPRKAAPGRSPNKAKLAASFRTPMRIQSKRLVHRVATPPPSHTQLMHEAAASTWSIVSSVPDDVVKENQSASIMAAAAHAAATSDNSLLAAQQHHHPSDTVRPALKLSLRLSAQNEVVIPPTPPQLPGHAALSIGATVLEEPQKHACPICLDKNFRTSRQLAAHLRHYHQRDCASMDDQSQHSVDSPNEFNVSSGSGQLFAQHQHPPSGMKSGTRRRGGGGNGTGGPQRQFSHMAAVSETASELSTPAPDGEEDLFNNTMESHHAGGAGAPPFSSSSGMAAASSNNVPIPPAHSLIFCPHCRGKEDDCNTLIQCDSCLCWSHLACHRLQQAPARWECDGCSKSVAQNRLRRSRCGVWLNDWLASGILPALCKEDDVAMTTTVGGATAVDEKETNADAAVTVSSSRAAMIAYLRQLLANLNEMVIMQKRKQELALRYKEVKRRLPKSKQVYQHHETESPDKLLTTGIPDLWDLPSDLLTYFSCDTIVTPQKGGSHHPHPTLDLTSTFQDTAPHAANLLPCLDTLIDSAFGSSHLGVVVDGGHSTLPPSQVHNTGGSGVDILDALGSPCAMPGAVQHHLQQQQLPPHHHHAQVFHSPSLGSGSFDSFVNIPITVPTCSSGVVVGGGGEVMVEHSLLTPTVFSEHSHHPHHPVDHDINTLLPESEDLLGGINLDDYDLNSGGEEADPVVVPAILPVNSQHVAILEAGLVAGVEETTDATAAVHHFNGVTSNILLATDNSVQDDYERRVAEEMRQILQELRDMDAVMREMQQFCGPALSKLEERSIVRGLRAARRGVTRLCNESRT